MLNVDGFIILQATNIHQHLCAPQQGVAEREDLWDAEEASEQTMNVLHVNTHKIVVLHCTAH